MGTRDSTEGEEFTLMAHFPSRVSVSVFEVERILLSQKSLRFNGQFE